MSIAFQGKLKEEIYDKDEIQKQKSLNFKTECIEETKAFFYDSHKKIYRNRPYIQFSFLDFGHGICQTLNRKFKYDFGDDALNKDSLILKAAFKPHISRHPIVNENDDDMGFIPRGLFDIITIVQRYKGLLIIRSNYGKILYNFSETNDIEKAFSFFGDNKSFFPGTLISAYIPAIDDSSLVNTSAIKPTIQFSQVKPENESYVSLDEISDKLETAEKENLYSELLKELRKQITGSKEPSLVFLSIRGDNIPKRILKKTLQFLLTDIEINIKNNIVVLYSGDRELIEEIANQLITLNQAIKNYKIHPLPIIEIEETTQDINMTWLGIYDERDQVKLADLLYEQYSIAKSDFIEPDNVVGHLNAYDSFGNLLSNFPSRDKILGYFHRENSLSIAHDVQSILIKYNNLLEDDDKSLYLCSGNYYQRDYVELSGIINDKEICNRITKMLFQNILTKIPDTSEYGFIGITSPSHKMIKSLQSQGFIEKKQFILLDDYHNFDKELMKRTINKGDKFILICDVFSSGFLTKRLSESLSRKEATLGLVAVIVSISDTKSLSNFNFGKEFEEKMVCLLRKEIPKFKRDEIRDEIIKKKVIRINPFTNIPIRLSVESTFFTETVLFPTVVKCISAENIIMLTNKFFDDIDPDNINVGFYEKDNLVHPFYFDTDKILKNIDTEKIALIFKEIKRPDLSEKHIKAFYPIKSGFNEFDFSKIKNALGNHFIEEVEMTRTLDAAGWKFPHNADYLRSKIGNNFCLILDDGSCSGNSIIQMIDEVSLYDPEEIMVICFIGRVSDHKREFFSRVTHIKTKKQKQVPISIYFVTYWYIPAYHLNNNPNNDEIDWLKKVIDIPHVPQNIKKIAENILVQIKPREVKHSHKYLITEKQNEGKQEEGKKKQRKIPAKGLLLARNEVGKIVNYRFYLEDFSFFDNFIKKYEQKEKAMDYFKEIELLCALFIYEPYLYLKIKKVVPDVCERIGSFVNSIIFENKNIIDRLTYEWDKKDIIHLFFIVNNELEILKRLVSNEFHQLISFGENKRSTTNYVLYRLLKYIPIDNSELLDKQTDLEFRKIIKRLREEDSENLEIIRFDNFINTLPLRDDFNSQIEKIKSNYKRQEENSDHNEKKSFNHDITRFIAGLRTFHKPDTHKTFQDKQSEVRKIWFGILGFISPILSFSVKFKEFLAPYPYAKLVNQIGIAEKKIAKIESLIFSEDISQYSQSEINEVVKEIAEIQSFYEYQESDFYKLVEFPMYDIKAYIQALITRISESFEHFQPDILPNLNGKSINIPAIYVEKLLLKELITNLKKYSKGKGDSINLSFELQTNESIDTLKVVIKNEVSLEKQKSRNGEGTRCLNYLSNMEIFVSPRPTPSCINQNRCAPLLYGI